VKTLPLTPVAKVIGNDNVRQW